MYEQWGTFTQKIADSKIVISFPRCMRNPKDTGSVATLTMRYWEAMLSRCVIVGHCPQELMDIVGYDPVVEADFLTPCQQIEGILAHLPDYQPLVDKNREVALRLSPWKTRMDTVFRAVESLLETS